MGPFFLAYKTCPITLNYVMLCAYLLWKLFTSYENKNKLDFITIPFPLDEFKQEFKILEAGKSQLIFQYSRDHTSLLLLAVMCIITASRRFTYGPGPHPLLYVNSALH